MRYFMLLAIVSCPLAFGQEKTFQEEYREARELEKTDLKAAAEAMARSYRLAVSAGNADYATAAAYHACQSIHQRGFHAEAGKFAREVIGEIKVMESGFPEDTLRRTMLFGFLEKGLLMEGRIGAAMQANRAAAETLRGKVVSADSDGESITVPEVIRLGSDLRSIGWRLVQREAELLDCVGRTLDARALLDEAAEFLGNDWERLDPDEHFYAFKLLSYRATIIDFLGFEWEAIQIQRQLSATSGDGKTGNEVSRLSLDLNLLRNLSQWEGPSEDLIRQARAKTAELKARGISEEGDRFLAKMELDLRSSQEGLDILRADAKKNADLGHLLNSIYAERDALVERSRRGENGLDEEFTALVSRMRAQGNKRGEPTIYREFGEFLLSDKRPAEALLMFTEALRLTRSFGWTLHEPALICGRFRAKFEAGDHDGARAVLTELEEFLISHPDMPVSRRVQAEVSRTMALARLGEKELARGVLALAKELAKDLPDYQKRWFTPASEVEIFEGRSIGPAAVALEIPRLRVQPLEIVSVALPGKSAHTRFTVFNPSSAAVSGHWMVKGPGAVAAASGKSIEFNAGGVSGSVRLSAVIGAGESSVIETVLAGGEAILLAEVEVAWQNEFQSVGPSSAWEVKWDKAATGGIVLDASLLEANPFCSVSLFHEVAVPPGEDIGIPFRLRSSVPFRFEYYGAAGRELLAIDANGNGDFTEAGDLYVRGPSGVAAAIIPVHAGSENLTLEIRIFQPDGNPILPGTSASLLEAEVHRDGAWVKEAEDMLK